MVLESKSTLGHKFSSTWIFEPKNGLWHHCGKKLTSGNMWIIEVAKRTPPPKHKSTDVKVRFHSLSSLTKCFPIFKGIKPRKSETPPNKNMAKYFVPFKSIIVHSGWLYTTDDNRYDFCKINIIISTLLSRFLTSVWSCISKEFLTTWPKCVLVKLVSPNFLLIRHFDCTIYDPVL